jgi:hypothetical protein
MNSEGRFGASAKNRPLGNWKVRAIARSPILLEEQTGEPRRTKAHTPSRLMHPRRGGSQTILDDAT